METAIEYCERQAVKHWRKYYGEPGGNPIQNALDLAKLKPGNCELLREKDINLPSYSAGVAVGFVASGLFTPLVGIPLGIFAGWFIDEYRQPNGGR
jgi:hypothetical protein